MDDYKNLSDTDFISGNQSDSNLMVSTGFRRVVAGTPPSTCLHVPDLVEGVRTQL